MKFTLWCIAWIWFGTMIPLLTGCGHNEPATPAGPSTDLKATAADVKVQAADIKAALASLEKLLPADVKAKVAEFIVKIRTTAEALAANTVPRIEAAAVASAKVEANRDEWKQLYEKEKKRNDSAFQKLLLAVGGWSLLIGVGAAVWFFQSGAKIAATISPIAFVVGVAAFVLQRYADQILLAGAVLTAVAVCYFGYMLWKTYRDKKVSEKANKEIVQLVEVVKDQLPVDLKAKTFGKGINPEGTAYSLLSAETDKIVADIRGSGEVTLAGSK